MSIKEQPKPENYVIFPPFPPVPPGVKIRPFNPGEWTLNMTVSTEDDEEYDSICIKTLDVLVEPVNFGSGTVDEDVKAKMKWNEHWEINESMRWGEGRMLVREAKDLDEKLIVAIGTFEKAMKWPTADASLRDRGWNGFKKFIGLMSNVPIKIHKPVDDGNSDDDDDDDGDDHDGEGEPFVAVRTEHSDQADQHIPSHSSEPSAPETKTQAFLRDPKYASSQFLSSHMLDQGWLDGKHWLRNLPLLLKYFINYLIHTEVLGDSQKCKDTLDVVLIAQKELIEIWEFTATILKDEFRDQCRECFGDGRKPLDWNLNNEEPEPARKKIKLDNQNDGDTWGASSMEESAGWGGGGASTSSGWGTADEPHNESGTDTGKGWTDSWAATPNQNIAEHIQSVEKLDRPIFPSWLSEKYSTGIVERSWRRVKKILPPTARGGVADKDRSNVQDFAQYHQMILEPWDLEQPEIVEASVGKHTMELEGEGYNPLRDDITVLVGDQAAAHAFCGMGLYGCWIELVGPNKPRPWYVVDMLRALPSYHT